MVILLYSHFVYSPLNSYVYIHWILDYKYILLLLLLNLVKWMALKGYALITSLMEQKEYVFLSIIFALFLSHGFTPDLMILGTMIPIPKDKNISFASSSNYRAIALSSILKQNS